MFNKLIDDNKLAAMIRDGSLEAFELLYNRYKKKLYYFSFRHLEDTGDSEEIVQIVFISIWEHRKALDDTRSIKSYIYKCAVNNIYNYLKKKAIRNKYIEHELPGAQTSVNQTYEKIFCDDLEKRIETIILSLPLQQQKIFNFKRLEGLSHEEIAKKLELSERTVENQIYRATKVLREQLKTEVVF